MPEPWKTMGTTMKNAYGQFYREGTFPQNTLLSYKAMNYDAFNVIGTEITQENVRDDECDVLDLADNYLWDKNNFHTPSKLTFYTIEIIIFICLYIIFKYAFLYTFQIL